MKEETWTLLDKVVFTAGAASPVVSPYLEAFNVIMYVIIYSSIAGYILLRTIDKFYDFLDRWAERKVNERKIFGFDKQRKDDDEV